MVILNSILPVFVIIGIGVLLKRKNIINDSIETFLSSLAYYLILPCMMFAAIYKLPFGDIFNIKIVAGLYLIGFVVFIISILAAFFMKKERKGAFVTSAFRSNIAYIGFPIAYNLYGETGLAKISVLTGFIAPWIIGLSVVYLSLLDKKEGRKENPFSMILKDPLIMTCVVALVFSYYKIWMPEFVFNTIDLLAEMGSPLMLIAVGAGLKLESIKADKKLLAAISFIKLIIMPAISVLVFTYIIKITNRVDFNIAVLTFTFPTALSSYVLVRKFHGDGKLCAAAITVTTLASLFTISVIAYLLTSAGM